MNLKHEIEVIQSQMDSLLQGSLRLQDRIHSLETKVGNTSINSLQNRITTLQEDIAKLNNRISALETKKEAAE